MSLGKIRKLKNQSMRKIYLHKRFDSFVVFDKATVFVYNLIFSFGNLIVNFSKEKGLINEIS